MGLILYWERQTIMHRSVEMCQAFICVMLKIKHKNKIRGTTVERVAREGRCKEQVQRPKWSEE